MKYITLEELERRKKILQEKLKQTEEDYKNSITKDFDVGIAQSHLFEVEYLIDYVKMKCEDKTKVDWCCDCKKFDTCKINRVCANGLLEQCALFEQK